MAGVLGEKVAAPKVYQPSILEAIPRDAARQRRGIAGQHGHGFDAWHLYELSWLDSGGRPLHCCGALIIPADSPATVESKSLKLYLNSLNFHVFNDLAAAVATIERDVGAVCGAPATLTLGAPDAIDAWTRPAAGTCIDQGSPSVDAAVPAIVAGGGVIEETLHSHLLRSLCPVTSQPDWATLEVSYRGPRIDPQWLLSYVLSFREHQDFHEQCVEQIYQHLRQSCRCESLVVRGFYLRRGGIDITPHRGSESLVPAADRLPRQ